MRLWPFRRSCPSAEATESLRQAERALIDAERRDEAAKSVSSRLNEIRARNHFVDAVNQALRGGA